MFHTLKIVIEKEHVPTEYEYKSFIFKSSIDKYIAKYVRDLISCDNTSIRIKTNKLCVTTYNGNRIDTRTYFEIIK